MPSCRSEHQMQFPKIRVSLVIVQSRLVRPATIPLCEAVGICLDLYMKSSIAVFGM